MMNTSATDALGSLPENQIRLAPVRDDLKLVSAPANESGSPAWMINDPVKHQFYRIGWKEFEILKYWHLGQAEAVVDAVNQNTTLHINTDDVEKVLFFLLQNRLVHQSADSFVNRLTASKTFSLKLLLTAHLYQRIPLISPDAFLDSTVRFVNFWFKKSFWVLILVTACLGGYLTLRQWDGFQQTFMYFFKPEGLFFYALAITFVKMGHEFAHAFSAKRFGVHVPVMGVAFIIFWPILFTDTTDAWKLDKKQRLIIGSSGVSFEIAVAIMATLLWHIVPPGPVKSAMFLLASTTWIVSLTINLNPFMRFDGYYLLSDFTDIPNLQPRAFELARWVIRRLLLGLPLPNPEDLSSKKQVFMVVYAVCTWIYRFMLYSGIAFIVYQLFFKLLGLILFAGQILFFIGLPVLRELKFWFSMRKQIRGNIFTILSLTILLSGALLVFLPSDTSLDMPGLCRAKNFSRVYTQTTGRIEKIHIRYGQTVQKGDLLISMSSPELSHQKQTLMLEVEMLQNRLRSAGFGQSQSDHLKIIEQQLVESLTKLHGVRLKEKQLQILSPLNGRVMYLAESLIPGHWISENHHLALIVDPHEVIIEGFVHEQDRHRLKAEMKGVFAPWDTEEKTFGVRILEISRSHTSALEEPYMASGYGGELAVRMDDKGTMVLQETYYQVTLIPEHPQKIPEKILRGNVKVKCEPVSFASRLFKNIQALLIRESSF